MEALVILLVLAGLVCLVICMAFYVRLWSTLGAHRRAMHALHQELAQRRLESQFDRTRRTAAEESGLGHVPPQEGRQ